MIWPICEFALTERPPFHANNVWDSEQKQEHLKAALLEAFGVNVVGVANTITAFLPLIKQSKIKKVITISTGMADIGTLAFTHFGCSPLEVQEKQGDVC